MGGPPPLEVGDTMIRPSGSCIVVYPGIIASRSCIIASPMSKGHGPPDKNRKPKAADYSLLMTIAMLTPPPPQMAATPCSPPVRLRA